MYPLDVILAGSFETVRARVRDQLFAAPANVDAEFPSVSMVLPGLKGSLVPKDRPWLFILAINTPEDYAHMRRIREAYVGHPILALVDLADDPVAIMAALRAGAAQVAAQDFEKDDFHAALECISLMFGYTAGPSMIIAVSGVTGGCGATTVATNLAVEIAHECRQPTILVELSGQMGTVASYLDLHPRHTTGDLFGAMDKVDVDFVRSTLTKAGENLWVLPGPQHIGTPHDATAADLLRLLDFCKRIAPVIVLDVPNTFNQVYFKTLAAAHHVVLVAEQKLPSIRGLKLACDTLHRDAGLGLDDVHRHVVVNRFNPKDREFTLVNLERVMGFSGIRTIANDHAAVSEAINWGKPLRDAAPRSKPLADIRELAEAICPPGVVHDPGDPSVVGKLRKAIGFT